MLPTLGKAPRQELDQQGQHLRAGRFAARNGRHHLVPPLCQQPIPLLHLSRMLGVDHEPVVRLQPTQSHRQLPGTAEEGQKCFVHGGFLAGTVPLRRRSDERTRENAPEGGEVAATGSDADETAPMAATRCGYRSGLETAPDVLAPQDEAA